MTQYAHQVFKDKHTKVHPRYPFVSWLNSPLIFVDVAYTAEAPDAILGCAVTHRGSGLLWVYTTWMYRRMGVAKHLCKDVVEYYSVPRKKINLFTGPNISFEPFSEWRIS